MADVTAGGPRKVDLRLWGLRKWDAQRAQEEAELEAAEQGWEIVNIDASTGNPNPLRPRDYSALRLHERSYRAWAFHDHKPDDADPSSGEAVDGA